MSLTNPPPEIEALRDMLILCSAITSTLSISSAKIYYPLATIDPDAGTATTLPLAVLGSATLTRQPYATQTVGLPSGQIVAIFYAAISSGSMSSALRAAASQLLALSSGLNITAIEVDDSSEPTPGMRDDNSFVSCTMIISWGLSL